MWSIIRLISVCRIKPCNLVRIAHGKERVFNTDEEALCEGRGVPRAAESVKGNKTDIFDIKAIDSRERVLEAAAKVYRWCVACIFRYYRCNRRRQRDLPSLRRKRLIAS